MATPPAAPLPVNLFAPSTTVASPPTTNLPLVTHKYIDDDILLRPREVVRIRLPLALEGPGSTRYSSDYTSFTRPRKSTFYTAIVLDASLDLGHSLLEVFLTSAHPRLCWKSSLQTWVFSIW